MQKPTIMARAAAWIRTKLTAYNGDDVEEGGMEVLRRLTGQALGPGAQLGKYRKSLYVFACVSKIAEKAASVPMKLFRVVNSRGEMKEVPAHPLLDLIYKPNEFQTKSEFWELALINLKCAGSAFLYKVRNDRGAVVELWNVRPDNVTVVSDPERFVKHYLVSMGNGRQETFQPEDVIHIKETDPLNVTLGLSTITPAENRIETEGSAAEYQRNFFLNSARPDAVLKATTSLGKETKEEIRAAWSRRHRGARNAGKIALLEGGLDYQVIALTQKEMDYIESMKATRDDILVAFKMPKNVVGIVEDVNRANAETGMAIFLSETILPLVTKVVEKLNEEMTYEDFGDDLVLVPVDPTPQNREMVMKEYQTGIASGYLLINEVRAKEGMPPITGGWTLYMPAMNAPVGGLAQGGGKGKHVGGLTERDAYEGKAPEPRPKLFNFAGRGKLKMKLEIREALQAELVRGTGKPLIQSADAKRTYAEAVNKAIDAKTTVFRQALGEFAAGQEARVLKAFDKIAKPKGEKAVTVTAKRIFDEEREAGLMAEMSLPHLQAYAEQAGEDAMRLVAPAGEFKVTAKVRRLIEKRAAKLAEDVGNTTVQGLERTLAEGIAADEGIERLRERVSAAFEEFPLWRDELIARTEATAANNQGTLEGFRQSGVANAKEWVNSGDARVREEHADGSGVGGEIVPLDGAFSNGLSFPSEPNCRCVIAPAFDEGA